MRPQRGVEILADPRHDHFVYRMSTDGGRHWKETQIEMSFCRTEKTKHVFSAADPL